MPLDLILRDARLADGARVDVAIDDGMITAVAPTITGEAAQELRLGGRVLLPAFVESHTHLDKSLTYGLSLNRSGTLREAIARIHEIQARDTVETVYQRAQVSARRYLGFGTITIRTHVDLNAHIGLRAVEALLRLRESLSEVMRIQLVALAHPLTGDAGKSCRELVEESLRMGVDLVGGAPALTIDPGAEIDTVFALATRYQRDIDLHMDESDDAADFCLPYLAQKTLAEGFQGRVTAGHCCSLAAVNDHAAARAIELVRQAEITVITLPSANMYLQGRLDHGPIRRGITQVRQLLAAGVPVACGSDNVRDPFNPFGRCDLLLVANLLAHAAHLGSPDEQAEALRSVTSTPARVVGLTDHAVAPGCQADLVVLDSTDPAGILADVPPRRYVIAKGKVVAETRTSQWIAGVGHRELV
ncbi:MAG TPA: amidohydrolase family protein [Chloroflexota bacterium]|nr:amidohydrolase family protein [Chloroflexota bacterium]